MMTPEDLPQRVLCFAHRPGDEVVACGGMLAFHAERGDTVCVVVVRGHEQGFEEASRRAAQSLALGDVQFLDLDPGLDGRDLEQRLARAIEDFDPELVYAPSPLEPTREARAAARALFAALQGGGKRHILVYGLERSLPSSASFDTTDRWESKARALSAFEGVEREGFIASVEQYDRGRAARNGAELTEAFVALTTDELSLFVEGAERLLLSMESNAGTTDRSVIDVTGLPRTTAVVSTWNKQEDLRENLRGLEAQTLPFESIVVVDNASSDGTAEMIAREFPDVRLVVMPNSAYGACETFNIGFASVTTELTAILDDDIVMPPDWLEKTTKRFGDEPSSTAVISTKIVEPGMPAAYRDSPAINRERYMSTFRGCASLARTKAITEVGGYDERLFIYGNERDMTCRLLNKGYRVLQYPAAEVFHKTPFGIKMGKRSLYYHARNAFLSMLKYAPLPALLGMPWQVVSRVLLRGDANEAEGGVSDATGTIGIGRSIRETRGAFWILFKAGCSVLANAPYCLARREVCRADDFELPLD